MSTRDDNRTPQGGAAGGEQLPARQGTPAPSEGPRRVPTVYRTVQDLEQGFREAVRVSNVLAPVVRIDSIPVMHAVSLRVTMLNPTPPDQRGKGGGGHVYRVGTGDDEGLALTKTALDMLAAAAGVSWYPDLCGRLDDGSDPNYVHFRAAGWLIDFDLTKRDLSGEKVIDLREGSTLYEKWKRDAIKSAERERQKAEREKRAPRWTWESSFANRLDQAREHILAMAESKAKNRAIRQALGIKSKYTPEEIKRPFVVPKLVLTGDLPEGAPPAVQERVYTMIAERSLGLVGNLYGGAPRHHDALAAPTIETTTAPAPTLRLPPPPVGATPADADEDEDPGGDAGSDDAGGGAGPGVQTDLDF